MYAAYIYLRMIAHVKEMINWAKANVHSVNTNIGRLQKEEIYYYADIYIAGCSGGFCWAFEYCCTYAT